MRPPLSQLVAALKIVGPLLGQTKADYCFDGRFRFRLEGEWSLLISADDAGRFRLDACLRSRVRATMWADATDIDRLKELVLAVRQEAIALVA